MTTINIEKSNELAKRSQQLRLSAEALMHSVIAIEDALQVAGLPFATVNKVGEVLQTTEGDAGLVGKFVAAYHQYVEQANALRVRELSRLISVARRLELDIPEGDLDKARKVWGNPNTRIEQDGRPVCK